MKNVRWTPPVTPPGPRVHLPRVTAPVAPVLSPEAERRRERSIAMCKHRPDWWLAMNRACDRVEPGERDAVTDRCLTVYEENFGR